MAVSLTRTQRELQHKYTRTHAHTHPQWTLADTEAVTLELWAQLTATPALHTGASKRAGLLGLARWWAAAHPSEACRGGAQALVALLGARWWPEGEEVAPRQLLQYEVRVVCVRVCGVQSGGSTTTTHEHAGACLPVCAPAPQCPRSSAQSRQCSPGSLMPKGHRPASPPLPPLSTHRSAGPAAPRPPPSGTPAGARSPTAAASRAACGSFSTHCLPGGALPAPAPVGLRQPARSTGPAPSCSCHATHGATATPCTTYLHHHHAGCLTRVGGGWWRRGCAHSTPTSSCAPSASATSHRRVVLQAACVLGGSFEG